MKNSGLDALYWALLAVRRLQADRRAATDPKAVKNLLAEIRRAKADVRGLILRAAENIKTR
jgi:hypothetical protein